MDDCAAGEAGVEDNGGDLRLALSGSCVAKGAFVNVVVAVGIEETGEEERTKRQNIAAGKWISHVPGTKHKHI